MDEPQVNGQLRRQRTGGQLRQGQAFPVFLFTDPLSFFHQITVHVAHQRHRTAEAQGTQFQKVFCQFGQPVNGLVRQSRGFHRCFSWGSCFPCARIKAEKGEV